MSSTPPHPTPHPTRSTPVLRSREVGRPYGWAPGPWKGIFQPFSGGSMAFSGPRTRSIGRRPDFGGRAGILRRGKARKTECPVDGSGPPRKVEGEKHEVNVMRYVAAAVTHKSHKIACFIKAVATGRDLSQGSGKANLAMQLTGSKP